MSRDARSGVCSRQILSTYIHIRNVTKSQGWWCDHVQGWTYMFGEGALHAPGDRKAKFNLKGKKQIN